LKDSARVLQQHRRTFLLDVPAKSIALRWIGQSSIILTRQRGQVLAIAPCLSNACKAFGANAGIDCEGMMPAARARWRRCLSPDPRE